MIKLLIAILISSISIFFYRSISGIALGCVFFFIGALKIDRRSLGLSIAWLIVMILGTAAAAQYGVDAGGLWRLPVLSIAIEFLTIAIFILFFLFISLKVRLSAIIGSSVIMFLYYLDHLVYSSRGTELVPTDFLSVMTAKNVAGNYSLIPSEKFFVAILVWIILIQAGFIFTDVTIIEGWKFRTLFLACLIISCVLWALGCSHIKRIHTWDLDGARFNGFLVNFGAQMIDVYNFDKPEGYSLEEVVRIEEKYSDVRKSASYSVLPNIVVIMDESYADLSILGSPLKTDKEITPFINSLNDNTIKGYALSSVFGGNTANTEYEFLTGNSVALFTNNTIVYNMYIHEEIYSIVSFLHTYNYYCEATHPYLESGWSRTIVYPLMGFDKMSFIEDYPQKNLIRDYVSDQEMFEQIVYKYETRDISRPWFLFGVTIQNHGSYAYSGPNYSPSIELKGYKQNYPDAEQYIGLIHETDKAVEYLINYFSKQDQPTIVVFFGDHLPKLDQEFYKEIHGGEFSTLAEKELQYTVPFFIWANYDINEEFVELTSINYLQNYVYTAAGIQFPTYNLFLKDLQIDIPAINSIGYYTKDKLFLGFEEQSDFSALINEYFILEYNSVFENIDKRSKLFFGDISEQ